MNQGGSSPRKPYCGTKPHPIAADPPPRADDVSCSFAQVMARKDALITEFADFRRQQLETGKFTFIRAMAKFVDPHTIHLSTGERLSAKHFILATGSIITPSPLPQLDE